MCVCVCVCVSFLRVFLDMVFQRYRPKGRGLFQIGEFESFAQIYGCMGRTLQLALRDEQIIRKWTVFFTTNSRANKGPTCVDTSLLSRRDRPNLPSTC